MKLLAELSRDEIKQFHKLREKRLNRLGIKVIKKRKHTAFGDVDYTLDRTNYKRKKGLFS